MLLDGNAVASLSIVDALGNELQVFFDLFRRCFEEAFRGAFVFCEGVRVVVLDARALGGDDGINGRRLGDDEMPARVELSVVVDTEGIQVNILVANEEGREVVGRIRLMRRNGKFEDERIFFGDEMDVWWSEELIGRRNSDCSVGIEIVIIIIILLKLLKK